MRTVIFYVVLFSLLSACTYLVEKGEYKKWGYAGFFVIIVSLFIYFWLIASKQK